MSVDKLLVDEWTCYFANGVQQDHEQLHRLFANNYKKRQIPQLISSLIDFINVNSRSLNVGRLPIDVLDMYSMYCQDLAPTQALKLWRFLAQNIKELMSGDLKRSKNALIISIDLLARLMMNTKYIDHNITEFHQLVQQLPRDCLVSALQFCLRNGKKLQILASVLLLCHVWGEICIFLQQYFEIEFEHASNLDQILSPVHGYFDHWDEIGGIIAKDDECRYFYVLLLLQSIRVLDSDKKGKRRDLICDSARFVFDLAFDGKNANRNICELILNNLQLFIKYWTPEIVSQFTKRIIKLNKKSSLIVEEKLFELEKFQTCFVTLIWSKISILVATDRDLFEKIAHFGFQKENLKWNRELLFELGKEVSEMVQNEAKSNLNDESKLENVFKIFRSIPFKYLTLFNLKRCLIGLIALLAKFNMKNELTSFCYESIVDILMHERDSEMLNFMSVGLLLKWLTETNLNSNSNHSYVQLLDLLLNSALKSGQRLDKLEIYLDYLKTAAKRKKWTKMTEDERYVYSITLNCLMENVKKFRYDERVKSRAFLNANYVQLCVIVVSCAKYTDYDVSERLFVPNLLNLALVGAESDILAENERLISDLEAQMQLIVPSAVDLISDTRDTQMMKIFKFFLCASKDEVFYTFWDKLVSIFAVRCDSDDLCKTISGAIQSCDAKFVAKIIDDHVDLSIRNSGKSDLIWCLKLFKIIPFDVKDPEKSKILSSAAQKLLTIFPHLIRHYNHESRMEMLILIMQITDHILRPKKFLNANFYIFPFHIFTTIVDQSDATSDRFVDTFNGLYSILNAFFVNHKELIAQKVSLIIKCISSLIKLLTQKCDETNVKIGEIELHELENCAMNLNRLLYQLEAHKIDFARVGHYLIADYVFALENIALNVSVKAILKNAIYVIFDLCDQYSVVELQKNLSTPGRQLFNQLNADYQRDCKFKTKQKLKE